MSLRDELIEAGARRLHPFAWHKPHNIREAEAFLDAALDYLTEHADEWWRGYGEVPVHVEDFRLDRLIAVLRVTEGET